MFEKFLRETDPKLAPEVRQQQAKAAYSAHMAEIARKRLKEQRLIREGQEKRAAMAAKKMAGFPAATGKPADENPISNVQVGDDSQ